MLGLLSLVIAYLLGGVPFGYLIVKLTRGGDVRQQGSGNIGATNVMRTTGVGLGIATLLLDIAKGFLAVWIAAKLTDDSGLWTSAAALGVIAGHAFPVFLGFKGGKAVASFVGAFAYLAPIPLFATALLFVAVVAVTKYISAGSILGAAAFPFGVWMIQHPGWELTLTAFIAGAFVIYRHKSNLQRIRAGTENEFRWSSRSTSQSAGSK